MKKKRIVVANWKMNPPTLSEARKLFGSVKRAAPRVNRVKTIIAPPVVFLSDLLLPYNGKSISFAAQNVFFEMRGAYTGEVSALQLKSVGVEYAIIGHSERRERGESDDDINKKVLASLGAGLEVILCVGEKERDDGGLYLSFVTNEIVSALRDVKKEMLRHITIAYEPIWAIGKMAEDAMKPRDMHEMSLFIHKVLADLYNREHALRIPVLYGGSAEPENVEALLLGGAIDGFLVGHASLDSDRFKAILAIANT